MAMKHVEVVGAVIVNAEGEILCARRSAAMTQSGLWEFPGGKLEAGESPERALVREIHEELGCEVQVGLLVADATHVYPTISVRLMTYFARITAGEPQPHEHDALVWKPVEALEALAWAPADLPTIAALQAGALPVF